MSSYKRIAAVKLTIEVLRHLADQREPVSAQSVARALDVPAATILCHLSTLDDEGLVRRVGEYWELDMGMALFWARYRARLADKISRANDELNRLEV